MGMEGVEGIGGLDEAVDHVDDAGGAFDVEGDAVHEFHHEGGFADLASPVGFELEVEALAEAGMMDLAADLEFGAELLDEALFFVVVDDDVVEGAELSRLRMSDCVDGD